MLRLLGSVELLLWHGGEGSVEVVYAVNEVLGEFLDPEVFCGLDVSFCSLL